MKKFVYELMRDEGTRWWLVCHTSGDPEWGVGKVIAAGSRKVMLILKKLFEEV